MSDWDLQPNPQTEQDHSIKIVIILIMCWLNSLSLLLVFMHQSVIPNAHFEKMPPFHCFLPQMLWDFYLKSFSQRFLIHIFTIIKTLEFKNIYIYPPYTHHNIHTHSTQVLLCTQGVFNIWWMRKCNEPA